MREFDLLIWDHFCQSVLFEVLDKIVISPKLIDTLIRVCFELNILSFG